MIWWQAWSFTTLGGIGGFVIGYYFLKETVEDKIRQEEKLKRRRIHQDSGRAAAPREHTGPPAVVRRARTRQVRRNP